MNAEVLNNQIDKIGRLQHNRLKTHFTIQEPVQNGFKVRISGLNGFVPYAHMPWVYTQLLYWEVVAPHLIGQKMLGLIYKFFPNPISIIVDAKCNKIKPATIVENKLYKAIVLKIMNAGYLVELGQNFDWTHGSILGFIPKNIFYGASEPDIIKVGKVLNTFYCGTTYDNKYLMGKKPEDNLWLTDKLRHFIGTFHDTIIRRNDKDQVYCEIGEYTGYFSITKSVYPIDKWKVRDIVATVKDGEPITVEVIGIDMVKRKFRLKMPEEFMLQHNWK